MWEEEIIGELYQGWVWWVWEFEDEFSGQVKVSDEASGY